VLDSDEDGDSAGSLSFSLASDIVELVILTTDDAFLQTLRGAVGGARRLWHVPSPDKVSDLLVAGQVGIVVIDAQALQEAAAVFITQIKRQFPDLVVVVAGKREDETALSGLITVGAVYRFIHKPMSPGRARLFADAAVKKYDERRRLSIPLRRRAEPNPIKPRLVGMATVALALVAAVTAGVWALRDDPVQEAPAAAPTSKDITRPDGEEDARERLVARAEAAILEERLEEAAGAIDGARAAGVDGGRVELLTSQLARARQRSRAAAVPAHARNDVRGAPPAEDRLASALSLAADRLREKRLIDPDNDNAKYYVAEALRLDPGNATAQAEEQTLALALLVDARAAIVGHDFARAVSLLDAAGGVASRANVDNLLLLLRTTRKQADAQTRGRTPDGAPQSAEHPAR
jgi:hypothetical protein